MGILDRFRRRRVPLAQLCYDAAYRILPHYAYKDLAKILDITSWPTAGGPFVYAMACAMHKQDPDADEAMQFRWHAGSVAGGLEYWVLQYPEPSAVDLSDVNPLDLASGRCAAVLAPYFSAIVREPNARISYWVLGQAPIGGGTTLRTVTEDGANANLGPGPVPDIGAFMAGIAHALSLAR